MPTAAIRVTETHHGHTLLTLGHAAEHLANSGRFQIEGLGKSDAEAVHILMGLSRQVFDEFATRNTVRQRLGQWVRDLIRDRVVDPVAGLAHHASN